MNQQESELAAALAAVDAFLLAEAAEQLPEDARAPDEQTGWRDATRLAARGIPPAPRESGGGWRAVERLRHGTGGFYGVVGL